MGYLQELQQELAKLLGEMDEAQQKKVARFVGDKILESYKNGIATGQLAHAGKEMERKTSALRRQR